MHLKKGFFSKFQLFILPSHFLTKNKTPQFIDHLHMYEYIDFCYMSTTQVGVYLDTKSHSLYHLHAHEYILCSIYPPINIGV
jgi:hypothetical protein